MNKIYLIRHGKTSANEQRLFCGRSDLPLSPQGREELLHNKHCFDTLSFDRIYHSGLKRAAETAQIYFPGRDYLAWPAFREFDFGEFELHSHAELAHRPDYQAWLKAYQTLPCPGGENQADFRRRIIAGWQALLDVEVGAAPGDAPGLPFAADAISRQSEQDRSDRSIAVVTHGGVIANLIHLLLPGPADWTAWQPACGDGFRLDLQSHAVISVSAICAGSGRSGD